MARRRHRSHTCSPGCAVEATLTLIDGKWKGIVLYHLLEGPLRFNALRRLMPNVTQRMLTTQLRELEEDGLLLRTVYAEVPPRVDYRLTGLGRSLGPILSALRDWAGEHLDLQTGRPHGVPGTAENTRPAESPALT